MGWKTKNFCCIQSGIGFIFRTDQVSLAVCSFVCLGQKFIGNFEIVPGKLLKAYRVRAIFYIFHLIRWKLNIVDLIWRTKIAIYSYQKLRNGIFSRSLITKDLPKFKMKNPSWRSKILVFWAVLLKLIISCLWCICVCSTN